MFSKPSPLLSLWICMFLFNKPPTGITCIWFYFSLFPTIRTVETLMMHSHVSPQWPWSWWIRVWACGSPRPESHRAHPAPRTAPPMVLCQMAATRKGQYSLNVFVRFTQSWCLHNIPFFLARAPLKLLCDTMKYQIISRAFYGCESSSNPLH